MCKVFGVTGITNKNRDKVIRVMKAITPRLCVVEQDGFGYAAINAEGEVYGEKWLDTNEAWKRRQEFKEISVPESDKILLEKFGTSIEGDNPLLHTQGEQKYAKYGTGVLGDAVAVVMHSRFSTCGDKTINEVHPFVEDNTALVHNGMIYNDQDPIFYKTLSTCDSEILLHQYNMYGVAMDSRELPSSLDDVDAYLACLVLTNTIDKDKNTIPILDMFKADATLHITYVEDLDVCMFCTSSTAVEATCRVLGYKTSKTFLLRDRMQLRLNAITGEVIEENDFVFEARNNNSTTNGETYYKSRYGENWKQAMEDDNKDYEEYYNAWKTNNDGSKDNWEQDKIDERDPYKAEIPEHKEYHTNDDLLTAEEVQSENYSKVFIDPFDNDGGYDFEELNDIVLKNIDDANYDSNNKNIKKASLINRTRRHKRGG